MYFQVVFLFTHNTEIGECYTKDFYLPERRNIVSELIKLGTDPLEATCNFAHENGFEFFWSKERARGYLCEVEKLGGNYYYFESKLLNSAEWSRSHIKLDEWLLSLPKPVALFACDDSFALQVSEMCKINNYYFGLHRSLLISII